MEWLINNFYIVAVIGFFIISALGRSGKKNGEGKPSRMPSFGGDQERRAREEQQRRNESQSEPVQSARPEPRQDKSRDWSDEGVPSGNGYSLEHPERNSRTTLAIEMAESTDNMDHRMKMLQSELDRIHAQLNRMTIDIPETVVRVSEEEEVSRRNNSYLAAEARKGIIWSEILGAPRSRRGMNPRR
ncbi:hypothetical protein JCM10914A_35470 [Paenibacillus sp. JCM 10914]|uniref:hypothetical protein n=1 Tax=Paenibacillus sp. JCM 10914 TaxID=1236974 RepID=UPI0003CC46C8|nr:hypothetical protein [Paenibacillus sp. JCM 10914]GAE04195.1 hypothetical protein JCM10914_229 [Paenibacillus sp. JCM 10914]